MKKGLLKVISVLLVALIAFGSMAVTVCAAYKTGVYVVATASGVNIRVGAGTGYAKVGAAAKGVKFTVSKISGSWGYSSSIKSTTGTKAGWVMLENCTLQSSSSSSSNSSSYTTGNYQSVSSSGSNIRKSASSSSAKVGAVAKGVTFNVSKISGSWGYSSSIKSTSGTKAGWVCLDYCKKVTTSSSSSQSSKPAASTSSASVKLNVPLFKQSDSRWKNVYIGTKTIGAVGCTTTSIAMVYSYNTGKTVYPDKVRNMLSYANNDLYWSSISKVGLTSKAYNCGLTQSMLSTIYSKLKAGRPVVIGASTQKGGSQHWVVITGYNGSSTSSFSTANFLINDPGYQNCTTLKAFLANGSSADRTKIIRIMY